MYVLSIQFWVPTLDHTRSHPGHILTKLRHRTDTPRCHIPIKFMGKHDFRTQ